jgi:hypothetical protein
MTVQKISKWALLIFEPATELIENIKKSSIK